MLGDLPGAFARQAEIIAVDRDQPWRQRLVIGVPDQVQAHVEAVLHALEDVCERGDRGRRNIGDTGLEANRLNEVRKFDGFERVRECLADLQRVADVGSDTIGILHPLRDRAVQ